MIVRTITIDGKEVPFKASAAVPRLYRLKYRRDIMRDLITLQKAFEAKAENGTELDVVDFEIFENVAYTMALHADPGIPATTDEWLEQFNVFSIYEVLPQLLELWSLNAETQIESKKNLMAAIRGK